MEPLRLGVTHDFGDEPAMRSFGLGGLLDSPRVAVRRLAPSEVLGAEQVADLDALLVLRPRVTDATLARASDLALVARWGVGFNNIDVAACSRRAIPVSITPEGTTRPVASANVAFLLALAHRVKWKDALLRRGQWADVGGYPGVGLTGRTVGSIGLGRIARETFALLAPFGMRRIAYDPYIDHDGGSDIELVDLEELARRSDFVCVNAALTPDTRHLLDARFFALLKPGAFLINAARGPIVEEAALVEALRGGRVAGAALDVFEQEPLPADSRLLEFEEVLLTPHATAWTDELYMGNGQGATRAVLAIADGQRPNTVVNPEVFMNPVLLRRLDDLTQRTR
jgi:phosphoglycerate dehydrogenase-like enzyme